MPNALTLAFRKFWRFDRVINVEIENIKDQLCKTGDALIDEMLAHCDSFKDESSMKTAEYQQWQAKLDALSDDFRKNCQQLKSLTASRDEFSAVLEDVYDKLSDKWILGVAILECEDWYDDGRQLPAQE